MSSVCVAIEFFKFLKFQVGISIFVLFGAQNRLLIVIKFVSNCGLPRVDMCTFVLYKLFMLSSKFVLTLLSLNVVNCLN